jgi:hypothetical protein
MGLESQLISGFLMTRRSKSFVFMIKDLVKSSTYDKVLRIGRRMAFKGSNSMVLLLKTKHSMIFQIKHCLF